MGCTSSSCWSWINPCTNHRGQCWCDRSECWLDNLLWWERSLFSFLPLLPPFIFLLLFFLNFFYSKFPFNQLTEFPSQVQNMNYPSMFWVSRPIWYEMVDNRVKNTVLWDCKFCIFDLPSVLNLDKVGWVSKILAAPNYLEWRFFFSNWSSIQIFYSHLICFFKEYFHFIFRPKYCCVRW